MKVFSDGVTEDDDVEIGNDDIEIRNETLRCYINNLVMRTPAQLLCLYGMEHTYTHISNGGQSICLIFLLRFVFVFVWAEQKQRKLIQKESRASILLYSFPFECKLRWKNNPAFTSTTADMSQCPGLIWLTSRQTNEAYHRYQ